MNQRDLRLILTKNCNYRCTFCHNEGVKHNIFKVLTNEDYVFLYDNVKQNHDIEWITLTGGEPLKYDQIESLSKLLYEHWAKITMVTNGSLLHRHLDIGKWLNRINISLHTLDQNQYSKLTQTNININHILSNIEKIKQQHPNLIIRLNATIVKWRNDNEKDINSMIDIAEKYGLSLKFVELYPHTAPDFIALEQVEHILLHLWFQEHQQTPRQKIYIRGKRVIILAKIFCWDEEVYQDTPTITPEQSDIFVSPDWLVSPYPMTNDKISLYDAIKTKNTNQLEYLLQEALQEAQFSSEKSV